MRMRLSQEELKKKFPLSGRLLRDIPNIGLLRGQVVKHASASNDSVSLIIPNGDGSQTRYEVLSVEFEEGNFEEPKRRQPVTP